MFNQWIALHQQHEELKQQMERFFFKKGVNLNTYTVCFILGNQENEELRMNELANRLSLSSSATSRLVAKLEAETGYIARETCALDNRGLYVMLTDKGRNFLKEVDSQVEDLLGPHF